MNISYNFELKAEAKKNGRHAILLRVTLNRKHRRITSPVEVLPKDFNKEGTHGNWVRRSNISYKKLNSELEAFMEKAKDVRSDLESSKQATTSFNIIRGIKTDQNYNSFIDYAEDKIKQYKDSKSYGYYKGVRSRLEHLKAFRKNKDLLFAEIDVSFLNEYEAYLCSKGLAKNTIHLVLKVFRTLLYESIKEGKFSAQNPFMIKKLSLGKVKKERLDMDQMKSLQAVELIPESSVWHVRNYFCFSFFCAGIRISDILQLKFQDVEGGRINYKMDKTQSNHSIKLPPKALAILELYRKEGHKPTDYIFPLFKNNVNYADKQFRHNQISSKTTVVNKQLKSLAKAAGIESNLSFHISRHSYADILRKEKVPVYEISNLLGHQNVAITQKYLAAFDQNASDEAHDMVMGKF